MLGSVNVNRSFSNTPIVCWWPRQAEDCAKKLGRVIRVTRVATPKAAEEVLKEKNRLVQQIAASSTAGEWCCIVVGKDADAVARFLAEYSGQDRETSASPSGPEAECEPPPAE